MIIYSFVCDTCGLAKEQDCSPFHSYGDECEECEEEQRLALEEDQED